MANLRSLSARLWPALLCAGALALMLLNARSDPFDPSLTDTARYGHNHDGALPQMATWAAVELVLAYVVLAPGSASRSVWRAILAFLAFGAWTLLSLVMTMHQGGIVVIHALWLMALELGIIATLIARAATRRG